MNSTPTLSCRDLGNPSCDYVARGDTPERVKASMRDHASRAHPEALDTSVKREAFQAHLDKAMAHAEAGGGTDASAGGEFLDDNQPTAAQGTRGRELENAREGFEDRFNDETEDRSGRPAV